MLQRWYWWSESSKGGGCLFALGSHIIDSLQWLTGKKINAVSATLQTSIQNREDENKVLHPVTSDDYCSAQFEFEVRLYGHHVVEGSSKGGFVGQMQCSVVTMEERAHVFTVSGLSGTLTIED